THFYAGRGKLSTQIKTEQVIFLWKSGSKLMADNGSILLTIDTTASLVLSTSTFSMFIHADCTQTLPNDIKPPLGNVLKLTLPAKGIQVYDCKGSSNATVTYSWVFRSPVATLSSGEDENRDGNGNGNAAIHYAGPRWKSIGYRDDSAVQGTKCQSIVSDNLNAIPQLLLSAAQVTPGHLFGDVTFIQRVNTVGGIAPASGCDATTVGVEADVPYTADYKFYKAED
ncbi:MAG: DUF3455 domain-containing protein, partial [Methylococcales bacterium]|nr:DUF3455 domain-containing protein [Methylococcales bacterium]